MNKSLSKIALAATLGFAITFTLSCSNGDDPPDGGGSNISDLPTQAYLPDGSKFAGSSEITLRIPFYVGRSSSGCNIDDICLDECTDWNGNEHECTEDQYRNTYDSEKAAGNIQNGQISLNLPKIDSKYLQKFKACDESDNGCRVSFSPENLAYFQPKYLPNITVSGNNNCWLIPMLAKSGNYYYRAYLFYFSESGKITGTKCNDKDGCLSYNLDFPKGWNIMYEYEVNADRNYTSDLSKIDGTLEWQIQCDY
jgi:hypothetical protein